MVAGEMAACCACPGPPFLMEAPVLGCLPLVLVLAWKGIVSLLRLVDQCSCLGYICLHGQRVAERVLLMWWPNALVQGLSCLDPSEVSQEQLN